MNIPLDQFEQVIDETILTRGLKYFSKGLVNEPEELSPGCFEAIVQGTEPYRVTLSITDRQVTDHSCTCPYDMGPVCKHVVALLFFLQQESLGIQKQGRGKSSAPLSPEKTGLKGRKTVREKVDDILAHLSPEHQAAFIREQCLRDPSFRRLFMARFTRHLEGESKAGYAQEIKAILQSAKGRGGFIEWNRTAAVGKAVFEYLTIARKHLESQNHQTAIFIACAVLEEMVKALQFADDSDGGIGGNIEDAMEILYEASVRDLPEENRKWLFDYAVAAGKKRLFEGWDWDLDIIFLAGELVRNEKESSLLLAVIESVPFSEYQEERVQEIISTILRKSGRKGEAEEFEASHMKNPAFREQAIKRAMEDGDLEKAKELAQEGIQQDQKDKPGLADTWVDWLLQIALKQKDRKEAIARARYLLVQPNRDHSRYFTILKSQIVANEWSSFIDDLITQLSERGRWSDSPFLAWVCIREERWKTLLEVCGKNFTLLGLQEYEKYLADLYPVELSDIYRRRIIELLERHADRNHYREAAQAIRRMRKIGASSQADELMQQLRDKYPLRKALMEELERV
ncbi:MAG TPA: SWIM zinc finger family protein [Bacteroidales bacterium]|nr:SWIM zinc finger family protein [Bacteroidales bacterium]HPS61521.1 SWIM zinc finger family protein [Bacteroidales bacterium]